MKKVLATLSIVAVLAMFCGVPYADAYVDTFSTNLVAASSQSWNITNAAQTGLTLANSSFTFDGWVYFTTLPVNNGDPEDVIAKWGNTNPGTNSYIAEFEQDSGVENIVLTVFWGTGTSQFTSSLVSWTPSISTWYHVAWQYNTTNGNVLFYVNGVQQGATQTNTSGGPNTNGSGDVSVGRDPRNISYFNGNLDDVRVWNAALSPTAIAALHSTPCVISTTNLVSWWKFDNNGNDSQGSNNLTANNTPTFSSNVPYVCSTGSFNFWQFMDF